LGDGEKGAGGHVLYRCGKDENNIISIYDASGKRVKRSES
jgi:hypothetical protein